MLYNRHSNIMMGATAALYGFVGLMLGRKLLRVITSAVNDKLHDACRKEDLNAVQQILDVGLADITSKANDQLHDACREGDLDKVQQILNDGQADINSRNKDGITPVQIAAAVGHALLFDLLIEYRCNLSTKANHGNNILHFACHGRNRYILNYILKSNIVDIDSKGFCGRTALLFTAMLGPRERFDLLVGRGCDLTVVDDDNNNVLHFACMKDNVEIVEYIISNNIAGIDSRNLHGKTPVMIAATSGQKTTFIYLMEQGCNISVVDNDNNNVLHLACLRGNVALVEYILTNNIADKEGRNCYGLTPLLIAAVNGQKQIFKCLVREGCNVSAGDDENSNVLHCACYGGNVALVDYIITNILADIESKDQYGWTPVMLAAQEGQMDVFEYLVERGCSLSACEDNNTVLHAACMSGNVDLVNLIIINNIDDIESRGEFERTPVMCSAHYGHRKVFDYLVEQGCNLSAVDSENNNLLHMACLRDNVELVDHIVTNKIADIESRGQFGKTPVMFAAQKGRDKVFKHLVKRGCNLSVLANCNNNILHVACMSDNVELVEHIITNNIAGIESQNQFGATPVIFAAQNGRKRVFEYLKKRGCDLSGHVLFAACASSNIELVDYIISNNIEDIESRAQFGRTPVMMAAQGGHLKVFQYLVERGCNVSYVDDDNNNVLHVACIEDNVEMVNHIITNNIADIESRGQFGWTPVMFAARHGRREVFKYLVGHGCSLESNEANILRVAAMGGCVDIVATIVSLTSLDINSRDYARLLENTDAIGFLLHMNLNFK